MVYIEKDKKLSRVNRNHCCKIIPEDDKKFQRIVEQRKKFVAKEMVSDVRGIRKQEAEKLVQAENRLELKRKEAASKRANLVDQWIELKKDEEGFRCVFVQFHQFVVDNRERIVRERSRIQHLCQSRAEKQLDIEEMRGKIIYFHDVFNRMKVELERHIFYENFVLKFADYMQAKNVEEVLYRYSLLLDARDDMENSARRREKNILNYSKNYNLILHHWKHKLIKFSEKLTLQSEKFEDAKRLVQYWEKTVHEIQKIALKLWMDIEMTREALGHVVSLLLIRMKAKVNPNFFKREKRYKSLLKTTEGKIMYMNQMLGDLMRVKEEFLQIYEEEAEVEKVHMNDEMSYHQKKKIPLWKEKKKGQVQMKVLKTFEPPQISPCTARILEALENRAKWTTQFNKWKSKGKSAKSDETSMKSYGTYSNADSEDSRAKVLTKWLITTEDGKKAQEDESIKDHVLDTRDTLVSSASSRHSLRMSRKSDLIPRVYSSVVITTDPSCYLIEEKRTKLRDRIVERNFDRYEKFVHNKMDTDSSLMKINKESGKLELPKLKFKQKHAPQRRFVDVTLPKLETANLRKQKKKKEDNLAIKSTRSHVTSQRSVKSKKDELDFEAMDKFFNRPTVVQKYTFGNLL